MTLVGWAADGFPIYSLLGHTDSQDGSSPLVEMRSSYRTVESPAAGRPSIDDFALGHFEQDWEYVAGSGDLDECNGRLGLRRSFRKASITTTRLERIPSFSVVSEAPQPRP